jgi:Zinc finger C-x8-C-x5-C-x3-H type (and similar)
MTDTFTFDINSFPTLPEPVPVVLTLESMIGHKGKDKSLNDFSCMLCTHLSGANSIFLANHTLEDCHRCPDCFEWDAEKTAEEHSKICLAYKQKSVSRKPFPEGLPPVDLCTFWKAGHCKFGVKCRYRHSESVATRSAREESGNINCFECGVYGHHQRDCIAPCEKCSSEDHRTSKCKKCYGCQKWGHTKQECTLCQECGDKHATRQCPYMK